MLKTHFSLMKLACSSQIEAQIESYKAEPGGINYCSRWERFCENDNDDPSLLMPNVQCCVRTRVLPTPYIK